MNKWENVINGNELSRKELKLEEWCLKMEKEKKKGKKEKERKLESLQEGKKLK